MRIGLTQRFKAICQLVPLAILLAPMPARSQQTTYTYTGSTMVGTLRGGTGVVRQDTQITGTVVLSAPLDPDKANQIVVPVSYAFDNGNNLFSSAGWRDNPTVKGTNSTQLFSFTTMGGQIVAWNVVLYSTSVPVLAANFDGSLMTVSTGATSIDQYSASSTITACVAVPTYCAYYTAYTLAGGNWQVSAPTIPINTKALACAPGSISYKVIAPSNSVSSDLSPNSTGSPSICAVPATEPSTWYIKTTTDGGATWKWVLTLSELGLGKS